MIAHGTVGWEDDGGTSAELGDSTNDGTTLVRVTLVAGRAPTNALDQTQAQGQKLLCLLADGVRLPARGSRVVVAIPEAHANIPGACVVIATVSNNWQALANSPQGDYVLAAPGVPASWTLRQNGDAVLKTTDPQGNTIFFRLGPTGLQFVHPAFSIQADGYGIRLRTAAGAYLTLGAAGLPSPLSALGSYAKLSAAIVKVDGSQVLLGPDLPGQQFKPAPAGLDPSPTPLLSALLLALTNYTAAVDACVASLNPSSGVTAPEQAAVVATAAALATAITASGAILTSNAVKVAP